MIKKFLKSVTNSIFKNNRQKDELLRAIFRYLDRDPLLFAYNNIGILNYQDDLVSGERNLIKNVLPKYLSERDTNIFFDVGANAGYYSKNLAKVFPNSVIYSFEPNKNSFEKLKANVGETSQIKFFPIGFSDKKSTELLYTYSDELDSQHASIYKEVFSDIHVNKEISSFSIELTSIDDFCKEHKIDTIDFLKIDTEGNEIDVLRGGIKMIMGGKIQIIQFEFNEMNIISRAFLKDFYCLLPNYHIFRLMEDHLIPMTQYNSINEIFKFQNLVAIQKPSSNV